MYILYYCCFVYLFLCLLFVLLLLLHTPRPSRVEVIVETVFSFDFITHIIRPANVRRLHFAILYQFNTNIITIFIHIIVVR